MAKRRTLRGNPLLVAGTTVAMVIGCGGSPKTVDTPLGNLMAPPEVTGEVCVNVVPANAEVVINGQPKGEDRCTSVTGYGTRVDIVANALGYATSNTTHELVPGGAVDVSIVMMKDVPVEPDRPRPPVGNLMPPPDLSPPPELPKK